jgi:hypothetical protein
VLPGGLDPRQQRVVPDRDGLDGPAVQRGGAVDEVLLHLDVDVRGARAEAVDELADPVPAHVREGGARGG